jgi:DnaJ like chaperone protein
MFGKIIAGLIGLLVAGLPGLVIGIIAGHWFDRGLARSLGMASPERLARARDTFFEVSFQLLGHIAKADGRVSEAEINQAEALMRQLGIGGDARDAAISNFKQGVAATFRPESALARFNRDCAGPRQVAHTLLLFLVGMAFADGRLESAEHDALLRIAGMLGYSGAEFQRLLDMMEAQSHFHDFHSGERPTGSDQLADAYRALGVDPGCSDRELKHAYRRLMSEHHPDKLIARGVPESMMKVATEKAQEIQAAYELAKASRETS